MKFSQIPSFPFEFLSHPLLAAAATHHYQENIFGRRASKNMIDWWIEIFFFLLARCNSTKTFTCSLISLLDQSCVSFAAALMWNMNDMWAAVGMEAVLKKETGERERESQQEKKTAFIEFSSYRRRGECRSETHSRTVQRERRKTTRFAISPKCVKIFIVKFCSWRQMKLSWMAIVLALGWGLQAKRNCSYIFLADIAQNWSSSRLRFSIKLPPLSRLLAHIFPNRSMIDDRTSLRSTCAQLLESPRTQSSELPITTIPIATFSALCFMILDIVSVWSVILSLCSSRSSSVFFFLLYFNHILVHHKTMPSSFREHWSCSRKKNLSTTIKKRNILRWSTASCCWRPMREEGSMQKCVHISNAPTYGMNQ